MASHTYCHTCGAPYSEGADWPRRCAACGAITYRNPLPVAVVLQPVGEGLLIVQRGQGFASGKWALPGGYLETGESWTAGAARELWEETGLRVDPSLMRACGVYSARDDSLIIFTLAPPVSPHDVPEFVATPETTDRLVVAEPITLGFSSHTRMMQRYFDRTLATLESVVG